MIKKVVALFLALLLTLTLAGCGQSIIQKNLDKDNSEESDSVSETGESVRQSSNELKIELLRDWSRIGLSSDGQSVFMYSLDFSDGEIEYSITNSKYSAIFMRYKYRILSSNSIEVAEISSNYYRTINIEFDAKKEKMIMTPALTSTDSNENWYNFDNDDSDTSTNSYSSSKSSSAKSNSSSYNNATNTYSNDFIFPESSTRYLTDSEIVNKISSMTGATVSGDFVQDAINEIYARNGYVFKTASILSYYQSQSWYHPDSSFTTNDFNEYEKYNINLLTKYR